jgi:hypothetical protein
MLSQVYESETDKSAATWFVVRAILIEGEQLRWRGKRRGETFLVLVAECHGGDKGHRRSSAGKILIL